MAHTVRSEVGIRRYFSPYLASAFLMLLGGYLSIRGEAALWADVEFVFVTQLVYAGLLVLVLGYLLRALHQLEEPLLLLAVIVTFVLDVMLIQHRYDWERGDGLMAATIGCASGLLLIFATTAVLGLSPVNRLTGALSALVVFIRFGPALLLGAPSIDTVSATTLSHLSSHGLSPSYVALGWMLAACLLPLFLLPRTDRMASVLPLRKIERWGLLLAFGIALGHFIPIGNAFDLRFRIAYLAPFVVLLPAAIERMTAESDRSVGLRRLCDGLPFFGIALAATMQSSAFWRVFGLLEGALTPFWLVLMLATAVQVWRSATSRRPALLYAAALPAAMSILGGNLSAVLTQIWYPQLWQVAGVLLVCFVVIFRTRRPLVAMTLHLLPSLTAAGWLAEQGFPWTPGFLLSLTWGAVVINQLCDGKLNARTQVALGLLLTLLPVLLLLTETDSTFRLLVAAFACVLLMILGFLWKERLYLWTSTLSAATGAIAYPMAIQQHGNIPNGRLCIELAFVILLLGFFNSLYGSVLRETLRRGMREARHET